MVGSIRNLKMEKAVTQVIAQQQSEPAYNAESHDLPHVLVALLIYYLVPDETEYAGLSCILTWCPDEVE